jgi:hypothetical protein
MAFVSGVAGAWVRATEPLWRDFVEAVAGRLHTSTPAHQHQSPTAGHARSLVSACQVLAFVTTIS